MLDSERDVQLEHFFVLNFPIFQRILNFQIAKNHSSSQAKNFANINVVKIFCWLLFLSVTQTEGARRESVSESKKVEVTQMMGQIDDEGVKAELGTLKQFVVDSEMENRIHRFFNLAIEIKYAHTLSHKLDTVLEKL